MRISDWSADVCSSDLRDDADTLGVDVVPPLQVIDGGSRRNLGFREAVQPAQPQGAADARMVDLKHRHAALDRKSVVSGKSVSVSVDLGRRRIIYTNMHNNTSNEDKSLPEY